MKTIGRLGKDVGEGALEGAGTSILSGGSDNSNSTDSSQRCVHNVFGKINNDALRRRSLSAIGRFAVKQGGEYLGSKAADAVTGSDDNQRCVCLRRSR